MAREVVRPGGFKGIFLRTNTPTKERAPVPVREPKVAPSQTPAPDRPLQPRREKKPLGKGAKAVLNTLTALALIEGTGAVVKELTNERPASVRTIIPDLVWPYTMVKDRTHKEAPVPSYFDPEAKKGTVKEGVNRIIVSQDVLENAYEEKVTENRDSGRPAVVFPVKLKSGERFGYEYKSPITPFEANPATGERLIIESPGAFGMNLDKGQSIIVPAKNAQIFKSTAVIDGQRYLTSLYMKWEQNGREFAFAFASGHGKKLVPQNGVMNAPDLPTTNNWREDTKDGLTLSLGIEVVTSGFDSNLPDNANFSTKDPQTGRWTSIKPVYVTDNSTQQLLGP